jgi:hypothetical protein
MGELYHLRANIEKQPRAPTAQSILIPAPSKGHLDFCVFVTPLFVIFLSARGS